MDFSTYTLGGQQNLVHEKLIGRGGYGTVHQVSIKVRRLSVYCRCATAVRMKYRRICAHL